MTTSPELQQLALNFLATFLLVTLQNNNRHTSARAPKIFPIRNMKPLSIRDPPPTGEYGGLSTGSGLGEFTQNSDASQVYQYRQLHNNLSTHIGVARILSGGALFLAKKVDDLFLVVAFK